MAGHCVGRGGRCGAAYEDDAAFGRGRRGRGAGHARGGGSLWGRRRGRLDADGTLLGLRPGDDGVVGHIGDDHARAQAVRFGIGDGAHIHCITALPGGPVVVRAGRQEIAIGRGLAARIQVEPTVVPVACAS